MKTTNLITSFAVSFLVSISAFADQACFKAENPQDIRITGFEGEIYESTQATMLVNPPQAGDDASFSTMEMMIATKTGEQVRVFGLDFNKTGGSEFRVECDGGGVKFTQGDRGLYANTNYVAGEILNFEGEGCASVKISMQQVHFKLNPTCQR